MSSGSQIEQTIEQLEKIERHQTNINSLPIAKLAELLNFRLSHMMADKVDPNYRSVLLDHLAYPDLWQQPATETQSLAGAIVPTPETIAIYLAELQSERVPNWVRKHLEPLVPVWEKL